MSTDWEGGKVSHARLITPAKPAASETPETDAWQVESKRSHGRPTGWWCARELERRLREAEELLAKNEGRIKNIVDEQLLARAEAAERAREGMVMMPREPTEKMVIAGNQAISSKYPAQRTVGAVYRAMFDAIERGEGAEISDQLPSETPEQDLVFRLQERARIRRQIATRKSVQEGQPDRIADLLEEAAREIDGLRRFKLWYVGLGTKYMKSKASRELCLTLAY